jgi:phage-related protein
MSGVRILRASGAVMFHHILDKKSQNCMQNKLGSERIKGINFWMSGVRILRVSEAVMLHHVLDKKSQNCTQNKNR